MSNFFETEDNNQTHQLVMDETGKAYMLEAARWTKFLGITYTVVIGLLILMTPVMIKVMEANWALTQPETPMPNMTGVAIFFIIVLLAFNFYPLYTMLRASSLLKTAIHANDQHKFNTGLKNARNHMKFAGIMTILFICFYGILILFQLVIAFTATAVS